MNSGFINQPYQILIQLSIESAIFDRKSYQQIGDFYTINLIVKYMYISRIKSIVYSCNSQIVAQLFVYNIPNKLLIGKLTTVLKDHGVVVDFFYDGEMTCIVYMDEYGIIQNNYLFLSFDSINGIKIFEIAERNDRAIGFTIEYSTNELHAYSKKSLFKTNYAQFNDFYIPSVSQNKGLFTIIKTNNNNKNLNLKYLMISENNIILKYENYQMIYQEIYKEEIMDIKYLNKNLQIIIAFSDHLKVYENYQYNLSYNWKDYNKTEKFLFEKFIDDDIFITFNKQIIQYDFNNMKVIKKIQLDFKSKLTIHRILSSQAYIVFGFQDGQILVYYKANNKQPYFINNSQFNEFSNKPVKFILEDDNLTLFISTIEGQIIEYNINSDKIIKTYILNEKIKLNNQSNYLSDLKYDKVNQRLLFIFIGQSTGYIWGKKEDKILSYFSSGNIQKSSIELTNKYIIISSFFQLNFYELSGESKFIFMIYGNPKFDYFIDFKVVENEIVIICDYKKLFIYYIKDQKPQLIERQEINFPFILEYMYNSGQQHLQLALLSKEGISEEMINIPYFINDNLITCSSQINSNKTQFIQMQYSMLQQKKSYDMIYSIKSLIPSNKSEIILNVDIDNEYISFLFLVFKNPKINKQIVLSPIGNEDNTYILDQNSFTQIEQKQFYLKDFTFQVNLVEAVQNKFNNITLYDKTEFVIWQKISFKKDQILKGIQINFVNLIEVILFDIRLSEQIFGFSGEKVQDEQSDSHSLFLFRKCDKNNNQFTIDSDYSNIFFMNKVKEVYIQNVSINKNQDIKGIFRFDLSSKIEFKFFKMDSNQKSLDSTNKKKFNILFFQGCEEILAQEIEFTNNKQIQLIQTVNYYELEKQIIIYTIDQIKFINLKINNNLFNFEQIFNISQSYISFKNINSTSNEGNIKIYDSKYVKVEESLFQNNKAQNGGAISIYNLKYNLTLRNTTINNNKALGNGGGLYLENVQTQYIDFNSDCQIYQNSALIGGGVRILNKSSKQIISFNIPIVKNNTAELYGDNTCTFLQNILIENGNSQSKDQVQNNVFRNLTNYQFNYEKIETNNQIKGQSGFLGYLQVTDFKSGGNLYLNIFFIDENQKKLKFNQDLKKYPPDIIEEIESLSIIFTFGGELDNSVILTGETILNHNLYNEICNCFQIKQLSIQSMPSITKLLQIEFSTNQFTNKSKVLVSMEFRKCQIGEVLQLISSKIQNCNFCSNDTYSLIDPNSIQSKDQVQTVCKKCPDSALNCTGYIINLKNGFWRKDNNLDEIISCNSQINSCKPEDLDSRQGCSQGFVGPLCEACDLQGRVWNEHYISSQEGMNCSKCYNLSAQQIFFILQLIIVPLFLIFNSYNSFQSILYTQTCYYLRLLQFLPISRVQVSSLQTSFVKIITTYLQFSTMLTTQASFLPFEINILPNLVGSSNKSVTISLPCIIPTESLEKYGLSFFLCLINFLLPLVYILFSIFIFSICKGNLKIARNQHKYILHILLSVIYMFFLLETVQFFTTMLTCRKIGSFYYNPVDLLQECNKEKYIIFLKIFSVFILVLWTIFPLILLFFLKKQKNSLNSCLKKLKYGYFYNELKNQYYYWEFIRILLKVLIVIVNTLMKQEYLMVSRQIIIIMFASYIKLVTKNKPFQSQELQSMEILSIQIIIAKILIQTAREVIVETRIYFESLVCIIEYSFMIYFFMNLSKYIINNENSFLGKMLKILVRRIFSKEFFKKMTYLKQTKFTTYLKWKKVKNSIQTIIKQQANYNMSILSNSMQVKLQQSNQQFTRLSSRINSGMNLISPKSPPRGQQTYRQSQYSKVIGGQNENNEEFTI